MDGNEFAVSVLSECTPEFDESSLVLGVGKRDHYSKPAPVGLDALSGIYCSLGELIGP